MQADDSKVLKASIRAEGSDVELWWPAGLGGHKLYNVSVHFEPDGMSVSETSPMTSAVRKIGLLTIISSFPTFES